MELKDMLHLFNNVSLEGTLTIIDKNNNNEVITITQEGDKFIATFSTGSPISSEAPSFPVLIHHINKYLIDSWEDSKPEIEEMDIDD